MPKPEGPQGPYTLWLDYGYEGWKFQDFPTLKEALEAERYCSGWHISKPVEYQIADLTKDEASL